MKANASIAPQTLQHDDQTGRPLVGTAVTEAADRQPAGIVLQEQPFDNTRDTNYFFASSGHAEALSRLSFLVEDRNMGIGLLTGEIGCGKTVTRTMLHRQLAKPAHIVVPAFSRLLRRHALSSFRHRLALAPRPINPIVDRFERAI